MIGRNQYPRSGLPALPPPSIEDVGAVPVSSTKPVLASPPLAITNSPTSTLVPYTAPARQTPLTVPTPALTAPAFAELNPVAFDGAMTPYSGQTRHSSSTLSALPPSPGMDAGTVRPTLARPEFKFSRTTGSWADTTLARRASQTDSQSDVSTTRTPTAQQSLPALTPTPPPTHTPGGASAIEDNTDEDLDMTAFVPKRAPNRPTKYSWFQSMFASKDPNSTQDKEMSMFKYAEIGESHEFPPTTIQNVHEPLTVVDGEDYEESPITEDPPVKQRITQLPVVAPSVNVPTDIHHPLSPTSASVPDHELATSDVADVPTIPDRSPLPILPPSSPLQTDHATIVWPPLPDKPLPSSLPPAPSVSNVLAPAAHIIPQPPPAHDVDEEDSAPPPHATDNDAGSGIQSYDISTGIAPSRYGAVAQTGDEGDDESESPNPITLSAPTTSTPAQPQKQSHGPGQYMNLPTPNAPNSKTAEGDAIATGIATGLGSAAMMAGQPEIAGAIGLLTFAGESIANAVDTPSAPPPPPPSPQPIADTGPINPDYNATQLSVMPDTSNQIADNVIGQDEAANF